MEKVIWSDESCVTIFLTIVPVHVWQHQEKIQTSMFDPFSCEGCRVFFWLNPWNSQANDCFIISIPFFIIFCIFVSFLCTVFQHGKLKLTTICVLQTIQACTQMLNPLLKASLFPLPCSLDCLTSPDGFIRFCTGSFLLLKCFYLILSEDLSVLPNTNGKG